MSDNKLIDPNYLAEIEKPHEVRLIDANALSAYLKETNWGSELLNIIDNAPTVEAYTEEQIKEIIEGTVIELLERNELNEELSEERPQGKWIEKQETPTSISYYCSNCEHIGLGFENFCAWCGAEMRGDNNELQPN